MMRFNFLDEENIEIVAYKWVHNVKKIRGVIQIAHGMTEHSLRYSCFAQKLKEEGFIVYAHDHRGHGETAGNYSGFGYIADKNGFDLQVSNMKDLTDIIKRENPNLPIILFGHSMGSFLSQRYAQLYGEELSGLILSGSNGKPYEFTKLGILISRIEMNIKGRNAKSKLMDKLYFGNFNSTFKPNRTEFDWLCSVDEEVDKYMDDEKCGFICSTSFYYDLLRGMHEIHNKENQNKIPKNLPIYIFSGDRDPVGYFGKGVKNLYDSYKKLNVKTVDYKLYKDGRHEMLNEYNKDEVIKDIIVNLNNYIDN